MAINFTSLDNTQTQEVIAPTPNSITPISLDLSKGDFLNLTKAAPSLTDVMLGASWNANQNGPTADLDLFVLLLNENGRLTSNSDVIFFNNKTANGVTLSGDNRTGIGEGDDETISINLNAVPSHIHKIVACVNIFEAQEKGQTFGLIDDAKVRLVNKTTNEELAKFSLRDDYSTDTAIIFAELVRDENNHWYFHAIGEGKQGSIITIAQLFS